MEAPAPTDEVKDETVGEDDDAWLYGNSDKARGKLETVIEKDGGNIINSNDEVSPIVASTEGVVVEPKQRSDSTASFSEISAAIPTDKASSVVPESGAAAIADDNDEEEDDVDEDSEDDDVQVTIGDIKTTYEPPGKFKSPYHRSTSQVGATPGSVVKPAVKGVDLEAVGNINGVPVYEFDLDSLKVEDKPWRKPGADITDYFNYGFNEDTWTKYCERQRRLRMEKNVNPSAVQQGSTPTPHRVDSASSDFSKPGTAASPIEIHHRTAPPPVHKMPGTIDVIGSSARDSRRPQLSEFRDIDRSDYSQHISSVTNVISVPLSMPPPHMSMPPPDFNLPPPGTLPPPPGTLQPPHLGPPPGLIAQQIMVGPPPGYPPPNMVRVPVDQYGRPLPGGPPPPERRPPPPGFIERPPYGFDPFGRPMFAPPPGHLPPAPWESRPGEFGGPVLVSGGPPGVGGMGGPPFRQSPGREESDFSSSDEERDRKARVEREKMEPLDKEIRTRDRSRSRDVRRSRDDDRREYERERDFVVERNRERDRVREYEPDRDRDRGRDYDERERAREYERERSREREIERNRERERERERNRSRDRSRERERERDRDRSRERDRDRSRDRDRDRRRERDERQHSKRRESDDDSRHRSKHKKSRKVKDEPLDDNDPVVSANLK